MNEKEKTAIKKVLLNFFFVIKAKHFLNFFIHTNEWKAINTVIYFQALVFFFFWLFFGRLILINAFFFNFTFILIFFFIFLILIFNVILISFYFSITLVQIQIFLFFFRVLFNNKLFVYIFLLDFFKWSFHLLILLIQFIKYF